MGRGNESLLGGSGSYEQDGRHVHICKIPLKSSSPDQRANDLGAWYAALWTWTQQRLFKLVSWVDLDLLYIKVNFVFLCFCMGKYTFLQGKC